MAEDIEARFQVPTLTPKSDGQIISLEDYIVVDVREDYERKISTLPNAISLEEFATIDVRTKRLSFIALLVIAVPSMWRNFGKRTSKPLISTAAFFYGPTKEVVF